MEVAGGKVKQIRGIVRAVTHVVMEVTCHTAVLRNHVFEMSSFEMIKVYERFKVSGPCNWTWSLF